MFLSIPKVVKLNLKAIIGFPHPALRTRASLNSDFHPFCVSKRGVVSFARTRHLRLLARQWKIRKAPFSISTPLPARGWRRNGVGVFSGENVSVSATPRTHSGANYVFQLSTKQLNQALCGKENLGLRKFRRCLVWSYTCSRLLRLRLVREKLFTGLTCRREMPLTAWW